MDESKQKIMIVKIQNGEGVPLLDTYLGIHKDGVRKTMSNVKKAKNFANGIF